MGTYIPECPTYVPDVFGYQNTLDDYRHALNSDISLIVDDLSVLLNFILFLFDLQGIFVNRKIELEGKYSELYDRPLNYDLGLFRELHT